MFPPRRVVLTLSIWLSGMAVCHAQEADAQRSAWVTLFDTAPILWSGIFIALIVAAALLIHLIFVLRDRGINPPGFVEAFQHAILAGNYQDAWETCNRWRQATLARILRPALERIGQGREPVEARLADQARREWLTVSALSWGMLGMALIAAAVCGAAMVAEWNAVSLEALSPQGPRALALHLGDIAVLAALAVAVVIPATTGWFLLRSRARRVFPAAEEQGRQLIATLPYEEIEGVRIGRDFNAGTMLGETDHAPAKRLQVSAELTTLCPSCNGPINTSRDFCPHCGQLFTWN